MKKIGPPTRLIAIFVTVDDFVNLFGQWLASRALTPNRQPTRQTDLDIDHTRHRSPLKALVHTMGGLVAYHFYDNKPWVFIPKTEN